MTYKDSQSQKGANSEYFGILRNILDQHFLCFVIISELMQIKHFYNKQIDKY